MMILVETKEFKSVLEDCYSSDQEFLEKYHDTPGAGFESCVERDVKLFSGIEGYTMHDVFESDKRIGYFGIDPNYEPPFMLGFFVKPEFRNRECLSEFWMNVRSKFPSDFLGECSHNNARALKHLKNNGGEQFLKNKNINVLKFKNHA